MGHIGPSSLLKGLNNVKLTVNLPSRASFLMQLVFYFLSSCVPATQKKKLKDSSLPVSPPSLCSPVSDGPGPLSLGPLARKSQAKAKAKAREVSGVMVDRRGLGGKGVRGGNCTEGLTCKMRCAVCGEVWFVSSVAFNPWKLEGFKKNKTSVCVLGNSLVQMFAESWYVALKTAPSFGLTVARTTTLSLTMLVSVKIWNSCILDGRFKLLRFHGIFQNHSFPRPGKTMELFKVAKGYKNVPLQTSRICLLFYLHGSNVQPLSQCHCSVHRISLAR